MVVQISRTPGGHGDVGTVANKILGHSECNMLHVTILAPRILRQLLDFFFNVCTRGLEYLNLLATEFFSNFSTPCI
jgi:hypothetical protein